MKWKSSFIVIIKPISKRESMVKNRDSRNVQSMNEPLGAEGPPLVREEVRNKDVGKVGS
jgi:hypothetical protein